jgi:DDE family transposase
MKRPARGAGRRGGFLDAWEQLVGGWIPPLPQRRGRKPRVPLPDLLPALTFHTLQPTGTLSQHFQQLFDAPLSDSAWSDRRQRIPWAIFAELMRRVLRPQADPQQQPDAFWQGLRLVALDGTQFNVANTPQTRELIKARTRRARAAFAKITTAVLLELGVHNPLAALIGRAGESEWALGHRVLTYLPTQALLLADRLYGVPAFLAEAIAACTRVGSHVLLRVRRDITSRTIRRYPDGSRLVRVPLRARYSTRIIRHLEVREIRVIVARRGHRAHHLRLWTTWQAIDQAPAHALAQLYTKRWEHEVYFRALKRQLRRSALLQSHTLETAAQEIAALVLVSALIAAERARVAAGRAPVLCISFAAVLEVTRAMWFTVELADDVLHPDQVAVILARAYGVAAQHVIRKRPGRSCPRALRQPIKPWPRLLQAASVTAPATLTVV